MVRFEEKISVMPPPVCHDREAARVCPPFIRRIHKRVFRLISALPQEQTEAPVRSHNPYQLPLIRSTVRVNTI
ncbi:hypothetical protein OUZ56_013876 [Daphnia magna]|uniref:Uncharacterized protein n=1 Tax=Daphnia magna TaxID=35525 RepID=A0ABQ9Z771_9CRUS|nr:hypothetical protein OUZ56_013876 [Daphnia magna]